LNILQQAGRQRRPYRSPIPKKYQWRAWAADPEGITGEELKGPTPAAVGHHQPNGSLNS
jgi:hypothetical protein